MVFCRSPSVQAGAARDAPGLRRVFSASRDDLARRSSRALSPSGRRSMSYRSVKRVLGETHLEWKCLLLFGAAALVLTGASFWFYGWQTEKLVYKQSGQRARPNANAIFLVEHFKA